VPSPTLPIESPAPGVRFPRDRVVAFYGNPLEPAMGVLGEQPPDAMLRHLRQQADVYAAADPNRAIRLALELVTPAAQRAPGDDGLFRARMQPELIERVAGWAEANDSLLILDVQVGRSSVTDEVDVLAPYLRRPYVHLALDPEFAMGRREVPGQAIGTIDAATINDTVHSLDRLVTAEHLPPKMLVVHRFTQDMVTHSEQILARPSVNVVIDMDGFGPPALKHSVYQAFVHDQPVQLAGIKLFYGQDKPLLPPSEALALDPAPDLVIYQ
jgi:hypothetical protein